MNRKRERPDDLNVPDAQDPVTPSNPKRPNLSTPSAPLRVSSYAAQQAIPATTLQSHNFLSTHDKLPSARNLNNVFGRPEVLPEYTPLNDVLQKELDDIFVVGVNASTGLYDMKYLDYHGGVSLGPKFDEFSLYYLPACLEGVHVFEPGETLNPATAKLIPNYLELTRYHGVNVHRIMTSITFNKLFGHLAPQLKQMFSIYKKVSSVFDQFDHPIKCMKATEYRLWLLDRISIDWLQAIQNKAATRV